MTTTNVKITRQEGAIADLANRQIGVEATPDSDLSFKMWGGKDGSGTSQKFLAKDQKARVSEVIASNLTASRPVVSDANKKLTSGAFGTTAGTFCEGNDARLTADNLQRVLDNGSTATIDTDLEISVEIDAPLSGTANPIYGRERIRNTGAESGSPKASQFRRRAEGAGGTSYAESNQTASESTGQDDFISDIAAVDTQTARIRARVQGGVATASMSGQIVSLTDQNVTAGVTLSTAASSALNTTTQGLVDGINEALAMSEKSGFAEGDGVGVQVSVGSSGGNYRKVNVNQPGLCYNNGKVIAELSTDYESPEVDMTALGKKFLYSIDGATPAWSTDAWNFKHVQIAVLVRLDDYVDA